VPGQVEGANGTVIAVAEDAMSIDTPAVLPVRSRQRARLASLPDSAPPILRVLVDGNIDEDNETIILEVLLRTVINQFLFYNFFQSLALPRRSAELAELDQLYEVLTETCELPCFYLVYFVCSLIVGILEPGF